VSEKWGVKLHRRAPKLDDLGVSVATIVFVLIAKAKYHSIEIIPIEER